MSEATAKKSLAALEQELAQLRKEKALLDAAPSVVIAPRTKSRAFLLDAWLSFVVNWRACSLGSVWICTR